jgi:lipopolysaccharide transport system ATP-binding protein
MENTVIEVKNIGKKYNISHQKAGYITFRDVLTNIFKNPFRILKQKFKKSDTEESFWALEDVNFTVQKGEVVGIIGHNGAGKSTLLKILSQITPPTTGEIRIQGTVGSLLEVGTGFHPELTGRENIFLNGSILGMKKKDIVEKFDEIVEFAGIQKFIDTPVKYYSSGMYVRLAFSVGAYMNTDILIIDEVLAVGDAEFQKKCLGKMNEITKGQGRTILFVSHDMSAVKELCQKSILLSKGKVEAVGPTNEIIDLYLNKNKDLNAVYEYKTHPQKQANITNVTIRAQDGSPSAHIPISQNFSIDVEYEIHSQEDNALLSVVFYLDGELFLLSSESDFTKSLKDYTLGKYKTTISIPAYLFNVNTYYFDVQIHRPYVDSLDHKKDHLLEITDVDNIKSKIFHGHNLGKTGFILDYKTEHI